MLNDAPTISLTAGLEHGAQPVAVPRVLGPYEFVRQIGVGGMGEVWLARDTALARSVAIKFVLTSRSDDMTAHAALLEGVRAVCETRHENLVAVYAADVHAGVPYVVMEHVDGPDLRTVLRRAGRLGPALAAACAYRIALGVGALHRAGIVHRDIKPGNVMVAGDGRVLVTDFGLSCQRRITSVRSGRTFVAGSPGYMAPEAFDGEVSARTDVYALGVTLLEFVLGEAPVSGDLAEIEARHRAGNLPVQSVEAISPPLAEIIGRALRSNLVYRYKDAGHFAEALRQAFPGDVDADPGPRLMRLAAGGSADDGGRSRTPTSDYYGTLSALAKSRERGGDAEAAPPGSPEPGEAAQVVEVSVACSLCGYDLRGVAARGKCPECGGGAEATVGPHSLHATDTGDVERLRTAATVAGYAVAAPLMALAIITLGAALVGLVSLAGNAVAGSVSTMEKALATVAIAIGMLALISALAGAAWLARASVGAGIARAPLARGAFVIDIAAVAGVAASLAAGVSAAVISPAEAFGLDVLAFGALGLAVACTAHGIAKNTSLGWSPKLRGLARHARWIGAVTAGIVVFAAPLIWIKMLAEPDTADLDTPLSTATMVSEGAAALLGLAVTPTVAVMLAMRVRSIAVGELRARASAAGSGIQNGMSSSAISGGAPRS